MLDRLKQIQLFEEICGDERAMEIVSTICIQRPYRAGETIIEEGEIGSELFIVVSGKVEIQKRTRAGDVYTVSRLSAEDNVFFGELGLIDDDRRSATVTAIENSTFLVVDKGSFSELGREYPEIGLPIAKTLSRILARRLRTTTQDMLTIFDALVNEVKT